MINIASTIASTIAAIIAANRRELVGVGVTTQRGQTTSDCYRRIPPPGASVHVANQDYLGRVVGEILEDDIRFLAGIGERYCHRFSMRPDVPCRAAGAVTPAIDQLGERDAGGSLPRLQHPGVV